MEPAGSLPIPFVELLGAIPDAALVATTTGRIIAANANLCALARYSRDELIDVPIELLVPNRARAQHVALRSHYIASGGGVRPMSARLDISLLRSDGIEVPVDVSLCTIPFAGEQVVVATIRDASVRRQAELGVERERAFLSAMNEVSSVMLNDANVDDTLLLVTQRARSLLDADLAMLVLPSADEDDALVVRVADGLAARELLGARMPASDSMAGIAMRDRETALIADGSKDPRLSHPPAWPTDLGATLVVPLQARGDTLGSLIIAKRHGRAMFPAADVTFMKTFAEKATLAISFAKTQKLEETQQRMRVAASRSAEELELQRERFVRLEELSKAKSDFVSRISHELRAPLTGVIGYTELLLDQEAGGSPVERRRMLRIIDRNGRRLLALVENLLTVSDVDGGQFELAVRPIDLADLIEHVREITRAEVSNAELELVVALGPYLQLSGDREQLERAIVNVVSNSVKYTPPGGQIEITTRSEADEIAISIRDTGCGIPPEEQHRLFNKFFRSSRSDDCEVQGMGLGLYIVKQIVQLHGGAVQVLSSAHGTTVTMRLPVERSRLEPSRN